MIPRAEIITIVWAPPNWLVYHTHYTPKPQAAHCPGLQAHRAQQGHPASTATPVLQGRQAQQVLME